MDVISTCVGVNTKIKFSPDSRANDKGVIYMFEQNGGQTDSTAATCLVPFIADLALGGLRSQTCD